MPVHFDCFFLKVYKNCSKVCRYKEIILMPFPGVFPSLRFEESTGKNTFLFLFLCKKSCSRNSKNG